MHRFPHRQIKARDQKRSLVLPTMSFSVSTFKVLTENCLLVLTDSLLVLTENCLLVLTENCLLVPFEGTNRQLSVTTFEPSKDIETRSRLFSYGNE